MQAGEKIALCKLWTKWMLNRTRWKPQCPAVSYLEVRKLAVKVEREELNLTGQNQLDSTLCLKQKDRTAMQWLKCFCMAKSMTDPETEDAWCTPNVKSCFRRCRFLLGVWERTGFQGDVVSKNTCKRVTIDEWDQRSLAYSSGQIRPGDSGLAV